jgi:type 1 glutamine amidotransferase
METLCPGLLALLLLLLSVPGFAAGPRFRLLVVASRAKDHLKMIAAAKPVLTQMALDNNFDMDFTDDATVINDENLSHYQAFLMLHLAPFDMTPPEQAALQKFIEAGHGWVGVHAAGLTGREFPDPKAVYWDWFEQFMGGVLYSPHPYYQKGTVVVEDSRHPVMRGVPKRFEISDEWYEWNKSPRGAVRILATADESTYHPNHPMGDHPIIWTNEKYRRMIYISIGHDPSILENKDYLRLLTNAVLWAGSK